MTNQRPHQERIELDLPARFQYLSVLATCLETLLATVTDLPEPEVTRYNVQLAIHEACTNVIEHAYAGQPGGRIYVALHLEWAEPGPRLVVLLRDNGHSFAVDAVPPPDLEHVHEGGYGLFLMRTLLDEVTYTPAPAPGQNCWRLVKWLH